MPIGCWKSCIGTNGEQGPHCANCWPVRGLCKKSWEKRVREEGLTCLGIPPVANLPRRRASRKRKLPLPPQEILNNPGRFLPKDVKAPPAVSQSEEVVRAIKFIADMSPSLSRTAPPRRSVLMGKQTMGGSSKSTQTRVARTAADAMASVLHHCSPTDTAPRNWLTAEFDSSNLPGLVVRLTEMSFSAT